MSEDHHDDDKTHTHIPLLKDTTVGHYRIVEKIGAGGMGEVYLAEDTQLDRKVALKFLPLHLCQDEDCRARFKREAQAAAKLDHPNIVTVHEVGEYQGRPYIAMAHVEGQSLKEFASGKELSIEQILELGIQICEGLQAAHDEGITHRDIKPSNILIDSHGRARVVDFGLASVVGKDQLTKTGSTLGTIGYMAPEQIDGQPIDSRADLFSMGVVLYELITGQSPFKRDDQTATLKAVLSDTPEPLARYKADVPDDLQRVVSKLLDKDPKLRYQSAAGVRPDLRKLLISSSPSFDDRAPAPSRRRGMIWTLIAAICLIVIVYFGISSWLPGSGGDTKVSTKVEWSNSIAVLPFRDFSTSQDQEPFCDGMTDAIIGKLSAISGLKVISMTSVMRYKSPDRDLKKIGSDLKVNAILEGSIQRENGAIRVRAQLINVKDDAHLWSEHYDRELSSVFAIQDDISRSIAEVMKIKLIGTDELLIADNGTDNVEAFNLYSHGRFLWNKRNEADLRKSIEYFEKAIELDSNYALAWVGLADAWAVLPGYSNMTDAEVIPEATKAIQQALALNKNLAEAHASQGLIFHSDSLFQKAEQSYLRAIELNPGYVWAHIWYENLLRNYLGRKDDALREEEIAFELNPMSIPLIYNRAYRKSNAGEFAEAEELYQRLIEIEPHNAISYWGYSDHLKLVGDYDGALRQLELAMEYQPNYVGPFNAYAWTLYDMGRFDEALQYAGRASEIHYLGFSPLAFIYDRMGNVDSALCAIDMYVDAAPESQRAYYEKALILANNGLLDSAVIYCKKAMEVGPDAYLNLARIAEIHTARREYEKADSVFRIMISHPDSIARGWGRGKFPRLLMHQGRIKEALQELENGINIDRKELGAGDPLFSKILDHSFTNLLLRGEYESVLQKVQEGRNVIKEMNPTNPSKSRLVILDGHEILAFLRSGEIDRADRLLEEFEEKIDPDDFGTFARCLVMLGLIMHEKGNYDSAVVCFERLLELELDYQNLQWLGMSYLKVGRVNDAIKTLEKSMRRYDINRLTRPGDGVLGHYNLGQAYEAAGRNRDAIRQYETFLDIWKNADDGIDGIEDAKKRLAYLKSTS